MNRQTANEPLPSSIQSGQRGVENACEFLQILWCIHNDLFSAIDLHPSAGQEAVHKLQPVDLKKPVHQSEAWQTLCYWWGPAKTIPIILYCALIMSHSDCTFIPSCSPITSHSAQSFHLVHPSLHTLHSHSSLHCSPITSHSAQSFQSALFTHHFTLCTVIPICIVHPSLHTLHSHSSLHCSPITSHSAQSFQSALFTHHFTLCTVIPICIVHPSLHTLHSHSNLHCSPITSHSIAPHAVFLTFLYCCLTTACGPQPEAFCFSMPSQFYIHSENSFNSVDYIQAKHC